MVKHTSLLSFISFSYLFFFSFTSFGQQQVLLDRSFGNKGLSQLNINYSNNAIFNGADISFLGDSSILISGDACIGYLGAVYSSNGKYMYSNPPTAILDMPFANENKPDDFPANTNWKYYTRTICSKKMPDGKVLVARSYVPPPSVFAKDNSGINLILFKVEPNGALDTSFGYRGFKRIERPGSGIFSVSMELQPTGDVLIATAITPTNSNGNPWPGAIYTSRMHQNGTIDSSYGDINYSFTSVSANYYDPTKHEVPALAVSKSGKLAYAGYYKDFLGYSHPSLTVTDLNGKNYKYFGNASSSANHEFDTLFGAFTQVAFDQNENIIASGVLTDKTQIYAPDYVGSFIMKIDSNGHFIQSFANNGIFIKQFKTSNLKNFPYLAVAKITTEKKVLFYGNDFVNNQSRCFMGLLNEDGTIDSLFGKLSPNNVLEPGLIGLANSAVSYYPQQLICDAAGRLFFLNNITETYFGTTVNTGFKVIATDANGSFSDQDSTNNVLTVNKYESNWKSIDVNSFGSDDALVDFNLRPDGHVQILSSTKTTDVGLYHPYPVHKIDLTDLTGIGTIQNNNGQLSMKKLLNDDLYITQSQALALKKGGFLYLKARNTLVKYDSTGQIVTGFGTNGAFVFTPANPAPNVSNTFNNLYEDADGNIFLNYGGGYIIKLLPNGTLDNTFASKGYIDMQTAFYIAGYTQFRVDNDKNIYAFLLAGDGDEPVELHSIFKLKPNGALDVSFGDLKGRQSFMPAAGIFDNPKDGAYFLRFKDAVIQPDNKLVLLLMKDRIITNSVYPSAYDYMIPDSNRYNYRDIVLTRLNPNGTQDSSFGHIPNASYGNFSFLQLPFVEEIPENLLLKSDGSLLVSAYLSDGLGWDIGLIHLNATGSLQPDCVSNGIIRTGNNYFSPYRQGFDYNQWQQLRMTSINNGSIYISGTGVGLSNNVFVAKFFDTLPPIQFYSLSAAYDNQSCDSANVKGKIDFRCNLNRLVIEMYSDTTFKDFASIDVGSLSNTTNDFFYKFKNLNNNTGTIYRLKGVGNNGNIYYSSIFGLGSKPSIGVLDSAANQVEQSGDLYKVNLKWQAQTDTSVQQFLIEISTDSIIFKNAGTVFALKDGNINNYQFTFPDLLAAGKYFYRVSPVSISSACNLPAPVEGVIIVSKQLGFKVFPNPSNEFVTVHFSYVNGTIISIKDIYGQEVKKIIPASASTIVNVSGLQKGLYVVSVIYPGKGNQVLNSKFLKL